MDMKRAHFSGSWYPETASACEGEILGFLNEYDMLSVPGKEYQSGIVPHAGWFFSGAVACHVINTLKGKKAPDLIVLFGKHLRPQDPSTIMVKGSLETPLGIIDIHDSFAASLAGNLNIRIETAGTSQPENTIELQLPFIRYFFPGVPVVPVGVPPTSQAEIIGRECVTIARNMGLTIKTIGSTDLTHYGPNYGFTPQGTGARGVAWVKDVNDRQIISTMISMDEPGILKEAMNSSNACCAGAAVAAVAAGKALGASKGELLCYTTSYDKSPGDSLVGYAGIVF